MSLVKVKKDYNLDIKTKQITREIPKEVLRCHYKKVRLSFDEQTAIQKLADKHTKGNTSILILYAVLHLDLK